MKEQETYSMNYRCKNCGHHWVKVITKGSRAGDNYECPNCGCRDSRPEGKFEPLRYDGHMFW